MTTSSIANLLKTFPVEIELDAFWDKLESAFGRPTKEFLEQHHKHTRFSPPIDEEGKPNKSDRLIISASGYAGSGKTTLAKHLVDNYGFKEFTFSSYLKDVAAFIFFLDRKLLEGDTEESRTWRETPLSCERIPYTPRLILQKLGTEVFRSFDDQIWVKILKKRIEQTSQSIIITDCRFYNELEFVKSLENSYLFRIIRQGIVSNSSHISERQHTMYPYYDFILWNDSTLEDFQIKIDNWMQEPVRLSQISFPKINYLSFCDSAYYYYRYPHNGKITYDKDHYPWSLYDPEIVRDYFMRYISYKIDGFNHFASSFKF